MKRLIAIVPVLTLLSSGLWADFSRSHAALHPRYPGTGPFIIEISGTWPSDCHPGEQKPLVESFDGQTVDIEFEIIVVHVTCNTVDTPYRTLVDMSDAVRATKPLGDTLDIRIDFQGETLQQTLDLDCPQAPDCADLAGDRQRPEPGIYHSPARANQGLLLARQNAATVIFPLVYDESGSAEWLFAGNRMAGDSFFTEVLRPGGGD